MSLVTPRKGYKSVPWLFGKEIEIPEEWEVLPLSKICNIRETDSTNSDMYVGLEHISQNDNKLVGQATTEEYTSNTNSFHIDDVLYGKLRPLLNKVWLATEEGCCSTDILPLQTKDNVIPTILLLILTDHRFFWYAVSTSSGTKMPRTNWSDMKNFLVFLPPLPEQQKIATILSNVDNLIVSTGKVITHSKKVKNGLMQKLLTRGIGHVTFKKVPWLFGKEIEIPEEWEVKKLEDVLELVQYGIGEPLFEKGEYPIFRMNSIQKGKVIELNMKFIDLTVEEFKKYKLEKYDLLFNRTNSYELVGKIGIFLLDDNYTFAGYLIRLRTNEKMNPIFLNNYLNTKQSMYNVKRYATPAVSQTNINATNLKSVIIIVPPRQEQNKIASILSNIDDKITSQEQYKEKLERLKKSLMQKLLTGEVRV